MNNEKPDMKARVKNGLLWGSTVAVGIAAIGIFAAADVFEKAHEDMKAKSELEKIFNDNVKALPDCKNEFGRTFEVGGKSYVLSCTGKPAP